jgi:hypothetical protein
MARTEVTITRQVTGYAPASISNLGPGFDILGGAVEGALDSVAVKITRARGVVVADPGHPELSSDSSAHTRHAAITPEFEIHHIADRLTDPNIRRRMVSERINIFNFSVPAHRLDAYRRLPVGWSPAPKDIWTDLHMWRKWLAADGVRFAASPVITSLHFSRGARVRTPAAAEPEVWFWRELFSDPDMLTALRVLTTHGAKPIPASALLAAARDLRDPGGETTARLLRDLAARDEEIRRMRATATWRYTGPLRAFWAKMRPRRS